MKCDWHALLRLVPQRMRTKVDAFGKDRLQEIRLRIGQPPHLVLRESSTWLDGVVSEDDLNFTVNAGSQYSPWSAATVSNGYITAQGGHRVGICGRMVVVDGKVQAIRNLTSLCIRVARDFPGIASDAVSLSGSILIIGSPGRGKTTLLRDLIRQKSNVMSSTVAVVDERCELFPISGAGFCFLPGKRVDVLSGCSKADGIEILIRTMNPNYVAVDEITAAEDCHAIIRAKGCGVSMLATAHAADKDDLLERKVYRTLWEENVFQNLLVMQPDKSWKLERMNT